MLEGYSYLPSRGLLSVHSSIHLLAGPSEPFRSSVRLKEQFSHAPATAMDIECYGTSNVKMNRSSPDSGFCNVGRIPHGRIAPPSSLTKPLIPLYHSPNVPIVPDISTIRSSLLLNCALQPATDALYRLQWPHCKDLPV